MKDLWKRAATLILSLAVVLSFTPFPGQWAGGTLGAQEVYADTTAVTRVDLTYDPDVVELNTAWTEGEVNSRVRETAGETTTGCGIDYTDLLYYYSDQECWYGIGNGTNQVTTDKQYGIEYRLYCEEGYDWSDEIKPLTEYQPTATAADCPNFEVYVNGTKQADFWVMYFGSDLEIYVPIPTASTTPIVTGIEIGGNDISLERGGSHTFTAEVTGTVSDKSVNWTVEDATSAYTKITSAGVLTIGSSETAETITVRATAAADSTKSATKTVTVLEGPPTIDNVTIMPSDNVSVAQKGQLQFRAEVEGTQTDKSVTWTVGGNYSDGTSIDQNGLLKVSRDETALTLTVTATPTQDPSKAVTVPVTVTSLKKVTSVELSYDPAALKLNPRYTEGEVDRRAYDTQGVTSHTCTLDPAGIRFYVSDYQCWNGIGDGSNRVSEEKQYGLEYTLDLKSGYDWPDEILPLTVYQPTATAADCPGFAVYVNGEKRTDFSVRYNTDSDSLDIWVPISIIRLPISEAAVSGTVAKTYTGKAQTQSPTVVYEDSELTEGTDYTISYKNNINAGTATMTITGAGDFGGTKSMTFTISPKKITPTVTLSASTLVYNGKYQKPAPVVKDGSRTYVSGTDYSVTYKNNKKVGKATVTVRMKGNYTADSKTLTFKIKPKKAVISKAVPGKKQIKVTMGTKVSATGGSTYQIKYRVKGASKWKTVTTTSKTKTIKNLKKGKKYQIKVRAYKKVNGVTYYGAWSKVKTTTKVK